MKYLLIIIFLIITSSFTTENVRLSNNLTKIQNVYKNDIIITSESYNEWYQCEYNGNGLGSFGIMTYTSNIKSKDGNYYYDIYLINNSYYKNGTVASSYIKDINIYVIQNGVWVRVLSLDYVLVRPESSTYDGFYHMAYIYNTSKVNKIRITWDSVEPY